MNSVSQKGIKDFYKEKTKKRKGNKQRVPRFFPFFRGELIPTEAELAEKDSRNCKTAEQLLERIKEEKARMGKENKRKKKRNKGG